MTDYEKQIQALRNIIKLHDRRWFELVGQHPPVLSSWDIPDDSYLDDAIAAYELEYGKLDEWEPEAIQKPESDSRYIEFTPLGSDTIVSFVYQVDEDES